MFKIDGNLSYKQVLNGIVAGIIIGFTFVFLEVSFAALIFSKELSHYLAWGIGYLLFGSFAVCLIIAVTSSRPGLIAISQDVPAAIISIMGIAIVAALPHDLESAFHTMIVTIIITSVVSGIIFLLMGRFRLGRLVRYIPFPVVGGFLAGTGWLLIFGAMEVMLGEYLEFADISTILGPHFLLMWLPGTIIGIVLYILQRRVEHLLLFPAVVMVSLVIFYMTLFVTGTSIEEARSLGYVLEVMPIGGLWHPPTISCLPEVAWPVVLSQVGTMAAIILVSVISILFSTTGIELVIKKDIDLDRELFAAGIGNIAAGLGGGVVGYHTMSLSSLGHSFGASTRLFGITVSLMCVTAMQFGAPFFSCIPLPILGGILMAMGLELFVEWVYDAWFKLTKTDYLLVILILVVIAQFGFITGVFTGLAVAVLLFVVNYSKVEVAKYKLDGGSFRSPVDRYESQVKCLDEHAELLFIMKLQGFIFFVTADSLLNQVRARINDKSRMTPRFVMLDFRHVSGFDVSAINSIMKMKQLAVKSDFTLVFTNLTEWMRDQLTIGGVMDETDGIVRIFSEFDYALEWCEDQIINMYQDKDGMRDVSIDSLVSRMKIHAEQVKVFIEYLERVVYQQNDVVIAQNAVADELYFIESGSLTVSLETEETRTVRLRTVKSGNVLGEVGMYQGLFGDAYRSASVTANEESVLYRLTRESLMRMEKEHSELATALHRFVTNLLSTRLIQTNRLVETLMK